jgi:glycosyltransferase involved in cell wall biosynthesis
MISVIIPAYNEEQNIKRIPRELTPVMNKFPSYEILIVDDGSKDNTGKISDDLAKKGKIRVVHHPRNMGLGAAVKTGIKNSKGDALIFLDSDFTFHPREIPKLMEKYNGGEYDCVIGTHFGKNSKNEILFHRKVLSKSVNVLYTVMLGKRITAMSSLFRLYKKSALKGISMRSNDFDINAEILFDMIKKGKKITEVPVTLTTRKYGESKLKNTREIKNHLRLLSKILAWRIGR